MECFSDESLWILEEVFVLLGGEGEGIWRVGKELSLPMVIS